MGVQAVLELVKWIRRLPYAFSVPFAAAMGVWIVWLYDLITEWLYFDSVKEWIKSQILTADWMLIPSLDKFTDALIMVGIFLLGVLAAYNLAVFVNNRVFAARSRLFPYNRLAGTKPQEPEMPVGDSPFRGMKIGIILAGGGAKGAYQAGAMRAIYEYLEARNALDQVVMIAGTSIGAWNSLFWLAGLVKPDDSGTSAHEKWWANISARTLVNPRYYVPLRANAFLSSAPWEKHFEQIFHHEKPIQEQLLKSCWGPSGEEPAVRFYLTRTNIQDAELEFVTNKQEEDERIRKVRDNFPHPDGSDAVAYIRKDRYQLVSQDNEEEFMRVLKDAVFASMDLPPMFPYKEMGRELFEDGGVIDNLPIYFGTAVEGCDFLFVVPLNAHFEISGSDLDKLKHSIVARLHRVMDMRQGRLERLSMKKTKIYNAYSRVRQAAWDASSEWHDSPTDWRDNGPESGPRGPSEWGSQYDSSSDDWEGWSDWQDWREQDWKEWDTGERNNPTALFAVCPAHPLKISTAEFWKPREAEEAFHIMYEATRDLLYDKDPLHNRKKYIENIVLHMCTEGKDCWVDEDI